MVKLSNPQQAILNAMESGVWYKASELPRATGHSFIALERKGLITSRPIHPHYINSGYWPIEWSHEFMKVEIEVPRLAGAIRDVDIEAEP